MTRGPCTAYVGCYTSRRRGGHGRGIAVFDVTASGRWTPVATTPTADNPSFLVADEAGRTLYAVHGDGSLVSSFRIDQHDGRLTETSRYETGGLNAVHLALSADERHLVVANYASGSVTVFARIDDGRLERTQVLTLTGTPGPLTADQQGPQPHEVRFDPTGHHIIVPDKGTDRLHRLGFDSATGRLTIVGPPTPSAPGAGPRHLLYHPSLPALYLVDELSSRLTAYQYTADTAQPVVRQSVSTLPADYTGTSTAAEIALSRDARCVHVSNRGHDSVATFAVTGAGALLPPTFTPTGGQQPRFMRFGLDRTTLYVANQKSDTIVAFDADTGTGALTPNGQVISTGSPTCIEFVPR